MKSLNNIFTSFSVGYFPFYYIHFYLTSDIYNIFAICISFLDPIGYLAYFIEISIPCFLKTSKNAIAGAKTCISTVVPDQSKIILFIYYMLVLL